jgi:acetyltransferase-like isoleucine patch superfamily enzyme
MRSGFSNAVGGDRRLSLWTLPGGDIQIDHGCKISNSTIVSFNSITILPETLIGGGCDIYDYDFHPLQPKDRQDLSIPGKSSPIVIGPKAFVGAHCLILKGVNIGRGAVVAAGSVVTKSIPPFELWGGVPARFICKIETE